VPTLADQIHYGPVTLANLDLLQVQTHQLRPAKATTKQHGQHCIVAFCSHAVAARMLQDF
jgi:hypothetical protein